MVLQERTKRKAIFISVGIGLFLIFIGLIYLILTKLGSGPFWLAAKGLFLAWILIIMVFIFAILKSIMDDDGYGRLEFDEIFSSGRTEFGLGDFIWFAKDDDFVITQVEKNAGMVVVCIDQKRYCDKDASNVDYVIVRNKNNLPMRLVIMHFTNDIENDRDCVKSISVLEGFGRNFIYERPEVSDAAYRLILNKAGDDVYVDERTLLALYEVRYLGDFDNSKVFKKSVTKEVTINENEVC